MRLERIKLAGFKSFVDPTTVPMPSNLVGIVGPNGCGKSNVIDAVRWVMGESSAKMLRGESMADVIFNGSTARKPVGTATIELVFDNNDGSAGGQYIQYNQISVKRQVSRDGQSSYFLNGTRCRRRDITDLFLGTGLGPRSYAIIEQGMISRLIEARPEELRVFLEEAAGISKYKERRRETENRIRHTRENLERLSDLREEVAKQLQHLKRQAATAERYQQFKEQERRLKAELVALRWRGMDLALQAQDLDVRQQQLDQEQAMTMQRRLEAEIEQERERHTETGDRFNEVQGRFYGLGAEISRLEQSIQHAKDIRRQQRQDLEQLNRDLQEAESHQQQDEVQLQQLRNALDADLPQLERARTAEQIANEQLQEAEEAMQAWQEDWDAFNHQAAEPAQIAQVERARINQLEQQQQNLERRAQRYREELDRLQDPGLEREIAELVMNETGLEEQVALLQERLQAVLGQIAETRDESARVLQELEASRVELQAAKGRRSSLETLQQAALGKEQNQGQRTWLDAQGLHRASRLAERLEVEESWRGAVETVLGVRLQAVCVEDVNGLINELQTLPSGRVTLVDAGEPGQTPITPAPNSLLSKIRSDVNLSPLLAGVYCADDSQAARVMQAQLRAWESVVTPDGVWIGGNWADFGRGENETSGVLLRAEQLKRLAETLAGLEEGCDELSAQLDTYRDRQRELEQAREQIQSDLDQTNRILAERRSVLASRRTRADHLQQRRENIHQEQQEITAQARQQQADLTRARDKLHRALEEMETLGARRDRLVEQRDLLRERLNQTREEHHQRRNHSHQIALKVESQRSTEASLSQSLARIQSQLQHFSRRREELQLHIEAAEVPIQDQQGQLQEQLERRVLVEAELSEVRQTLEAIDQALRRCEQQRHEVEQRVQAIRASLDQLRLKRQELLIRSKTLEEQLGETGFEKEALFETMPEDAQAEQWQAQLDQLGARIQRLGPINLAAIDEFAEQSERMQYLDSQYADVNEALETLESAIRKIDRETRTRFKETFDKVNSGLQDMFPKLFGGGHAYLELTGDDLLDTGVSVMARPPGKRNSSIHLLSGGEKALTAVALVFAIFKLNPAPFCMLDEVDAPLDDANVSRFCDLVSTMSDQIQFIFITHNKVTMEIANHLTGVTMHEPGVSRLVSVDVEEAARLAAL